jgi:aryl-alcohol dehydrogenase-like predicted oxidoreductase
MEYHQLGRTGVQVSPLSLGGMLFGGKTPEAAAHTIIDHALDAGINCIDTANIYVRGRSEEVIGAAQRRNGKRSRVVLATKVFARMDDDDPTTAGIHRRHIREQCPARRSSRITMKILRRTSIRLSTVGKEQFS